VIPGEHEFEAAHGLPEPLPANERLLWQGAPQEERLARDVFHWRKVALYFAILVAWRMAVVLHDGGTFAAALLAAAWLVPMAMFALGILRLLARLSARTTVYTLTDRRVVMRVGIVLTLTFNLPFRQIDSASLREGPEGIGDIALTLAKGNQIAYLNLWPHARPWQLKAPQPMLRAVPDARRVAALLSTALQATLAGAESAQAAAVPTPPATAAANSSPRPSLRPDIRAAA